MKKYNVYISKEARLDLKEIADFIADEIKAPLTARKYAEGLVGQIKQLSKHAGTISVDKYKTVLKYGDNARHIIYKKHIIIYTLQGNFVVVRRIMASSLVKE